MATVFIVFGFIWWVTMFTTRRARWSRWEERRERRLGSREQSETLDRITGLLTDMSARLDRLEEERDFYRELLGSGTRFRKEPAPEQETPSGGARRQT